MGNTAPETMNNAEVLRLFSSVLLNQPPPVLRELRCVQAGFWGAVLAVPTMHVILWLLGYSPGGIRKASPATRIHSWEARRYGGGVPPVGVTASAQRTGTGKLTVVTWLQTASVMAMGAFVGVKYWQLKTSNQLPMELLNLEDSLFETMTLIVQWVRSVAVSRGS